MSHKQIFQGKNDADKLSECQGNLKANITIKSQQSQPRHQTFNFNLLSAL